MEKASGSTYAVQTPRMKVKVGNCNETLRHLAIMHVTKMDKKRKCDEEE